MSSSRLPKRLNNPLWPKPGDKMSKATPIAIRPESPHSRSTPHASRITTPHQLPSTNYDSRRTPALLYLAFALLKGKSRQFLRNLRRPTTALGFGSLLFVFGILF